MADAEKGRETILELESTDRKEVEVIFRKENSAPAQTPSPDRDYGLNNATKDGDDVCVRALSNIHTLRFPT